MRCLSYTVSLSALLAVASPAVADLTAAEVWQDWQDYMQGFGYSMTGTESASGGTLTVSDVKMAVELPEVDGSFAMTLPELVFKETGNGAVSVEFPDNMPMGFNVTTERGEAVQGRVDYIQTTPVMIVTGDASDFTYTYSAEAVEMVLAMLTIDGQPIPPEMMSMSMALGAVNNITRMTVGDVRSYDQTMTAASLRYDVAFDIPEDEDGGTGTISGAIEGLNINGGGTLPTEVDTTDLAAMIGAGLTGTGGFTYTGGAMNIDMVSPNGPLQATTSSTGGAVQFSMDKTGLAYDVSQTGLDVTAQMAGLPFPVSFQMDTSAFNLKMPIAPSDAEQDFAFGFTMGDFTINEMIWGMLDPAGQLPRDPATIALNLTGKAKMLFDIMNPEAMETAMVNGENPGELNALNIDKILVSAVGAKLSGSGGFTFDNSDTETFDGMPRPSGAVDVELVGANGLIDKLVAMGFVQDEQAMGARMMMGLFGVATGPDTLTSKIEVNDQGHVLANGQRLR